MSTIFVVSGAFAEPDIAPSASTADCKYAPLETYSGTSNLQADWSANEINLRWYNNNTLMDVDTASADCTYDGTLTPPTAPSRTGYTFKGWRVRPTMDFANLNKSITGSMGYGLGGNGYCLYGRSMSDYVSNDCTQEFNDLRKGEWKAEFSYGIIYGMAKCSTTAGTFGKLGDPDDTYGGYCWCKVTGYKPINQDTKYGALKNMPWIYNTYTDTTLCNSVCAARCAFYSETAIEFRSSILTGVD